MSKINLIITTPLQTVFSGEVDQLTITTTSGEITILPRHVPLISTLKIGHVMVKNNGKETYFAIDGGVLEVRRNSSVIVLSDRSEIAEEIDIERAQEAVQNAEEYLKDPDKFDTVNYKKLQAILEKEQNRARLARKGHRK